MTEGPVRTSPQLAIHRAGFRPGQVEACAARLESGRSVLSPLTTEQPALEEQAREEMADQGVLTRGDEPLPTEPWGEALATLSCPTERWHLLLDEGDRIAESWLFGRPEEPPRTLVSWRPEEDGGVGVAFPVAHRDVLLLIGDALADVDLDEDTADPFWETFEATELTVLSAFAAAGSWATDQEPEPISDRELSRPAESGKRTRRALQIACAMRPIDGLEAIGAGLSSLRRRGLVLRLPSGHHTAQPDLVPLLAALRAPERTIRIELARVGAGDRVEVVEFGLLVGAGGLWLLESDTDPDDATVAIRRATWSYLSRMLTRLAMHPARAHDDNRAAVEMEWRARMTDPTSAAPDPVQRYELTSAELACLFAAGGVVPSVPDLAELTPATGQEASRIEQELGRRGWLADGAGPSEHWVPVVEALARPDLEIVEIGGVLPNLGVARRHVRIREDRAFAVGHGVEDVRHRIAFPLADGALFPIAEGLLGSGVGAPLSDFRARLTQRELTGLVALVDAWRARVLERTLARSPDAPGTLTDKEIRSALEEGLRHDDSSWLVTLARKIAPGGFPLAAGALDAALDDLRGRGWLERTEKGWSPQPPLQGALRSLSSVVAASGATLVARGEGDPRLLAAVMGVWTSSTLWLFRTVGTNEGIRVDVAGVLPLELQLELADAFHSACASLRGADEAAPTRRAARESADGDEVACPECGTATPLGRFCRSCGASLRGACGSCGADLRPGKAFCTSCGAPTT